MGASVAAWRVRARGAGVLACLITVGVALVGSLMFAREASATTCSTGAVTFSSTGAEQCYTVPSGVTSLRIVAVGARGASQGSGAGGFGAVVTGQITVTAGQTLYVEVGASGSVNGGVSFGGGGSAGGDAGSGGGASDVRTMPAAGGAASLSSRLLVAGGGGGAGDFGLGLSASPNGGAGGSAGIDALGDGGAGGTGGNYSSTDTGGTGGGEGTPSAGGAAGVGGSGGSGGSNGDAGASGSFGAGANGPEGGGGGGGYYGGGSGGGNGIDSFEDFAAEGGGGAGSSFVSQFVVDATVGADATGTPEVTVVPLVATVSYSPEAGLSFSGTQPIETISSPETVTIHNTGTGPLQISGLTFSGSDPQDFLVTYNACMGLIAPGGDCTLGVSFAPQAQGASSASLQITSNDPSSPAVVSLSGTGGLLPQGPAGQTGATGTSGATGTTGAAGPRGPKGPAGKVELVTCKTARNGNEKCTTKLVSKPLKFKAAPSAARARVERGRVLCATGFALPTAHHGWQLLLSYRRRMTAGRYTMTLRRRSAGRWLTDRQTITIA